MPLKVDRQLSFIVPALNEEERTADTVAEIVSAAEVLDGYEVLLIDDGSTDLTVNCMKLLAENNQAVHVFSHEQNMGLGAAYKTGLINATKPFVMMIPGDNQFPAASIIPLFSKIGEADIVVPFHFNAHQVRPLFRQVISDLYTWLANQLSGFKLPYYNGTVIHRTDLVRQVEISTNGFAYQLEAIVKLLQQDASFISIGIELKEREGGESKAFRFNNIIQVMRVFFELLKSRVGKKLIRSSKRNAT